ncbi:MAG: hypothetical protein RMX96_29540 [Nostoc sp. ChiSLP02]|nr:hypothetical protein [Nostoc sp. DedSLP05]MDZ8101052.1 hypothetical protein [Nostoc sp. DedSLP01]MDZ8188984.1 hypothetical protein [Nostoc sp. ChiSLP02]
MKLKLTRRQFAQLALASTTVAAMGVVFGKTLAQESDADTLILGINVGVKNNNASTGMDSDIIELGEPTQNTDPSTLQPIVVQSFNVSTKEIKNVLTTAPILETCERLSGFASINGKLIAAASYTCTRKKKDRKVRLIDLNTLESVNISGLKRREDVYQLVRLKDSSLAALVGKDKGKGSSKLATIDLNTGQITDRSKIPQQMQVIAVAESPDGSLYGIDTDSVGEISFSEIGEKRSTKLKTQGKILNNGCDGLVYTSSNELFALVSFRYESPKHVDKINQETGEIEPIKGFDVAKITLA